MHSIALSYPSLDQPLHLHNMAPTLHVAVFFVTHMSLMRIACIIMDGELFTEVRGKNSVCTAKNLVSSLSSSWLPVAPQENISLSVFALAMKWSQSPYYAGVVQVTTGSKAISGQEDRHIGEETGT